MTSIDTFQDILNALEEDPALQEQLRRHILTDDLRQLPAAVEELRTNVSEIRTDMAKMGGDVRRLTSKDYEDDDVSLSLPFCPCLGHVRV